MKKRKDQFAPDMKKNLKSILALLLAVLTAASIAACIPPAGSFANNGNQGDTQPGLTVFDAVPTQQPTPQATTTPQTTPTPTPEAAATPTPAPAATPAPTATLAPTATPCPVDENGIYDTKDEVALYIHIFGQLPSNYITKKDAQALGWTGGSLEPYAPGKCIGGDYFGNYEGQLPTKRGRTYHECDIGTLGKSGRGAKRIVYSNDGLIYYTGDHYEHFTLLYGGNN